MTAVRALNLTNTPVPHYMADHQKLMLIEAQHLTVLAASLPKTAFSEGIFKRILGQINALAAEFDTTEAAVLLKRPTINAPWNIEAVDTSIHTMWFIRNLRLCDATGKFVEGF